MTPSPRPTKLGIAFLGLVLVGLVGTIAIGVLKSERPRQSQDPDDEAELASPMHRPRPISRKRTFEKVSLITVLPFKRPDQQSLPGIGLLKFMMGQGKRGDTVAWFKGPPELSQGRFEASIKFDGYESTPLRIFKTENAKVSYILIPARYPTGIDRGKLTITQDGKDVGHWDIKGLTPTKELWTAKPRTDEARYGPLAIHLNTYRTPGKGVPTLIFNFKTWQTNGVPSSAPSDPSITDEWEVRRRFSIAPRYGLGVDIWQTSASVSTRPGPQVEEQGFEDGTYANIIGDWMVRGEFVHYRLYDEKIQLHGVTVAETPVRPQGKGLSAQPPMSTWAQGKKTRIFSLGGEKPISIVTGSGAKLKFFPQKTMALPFFSDGRDHFVVAYRLEAGERHDTSLPKSPISEGGRYPVRLAITPQEGDRQLLSLPGTDTFSKELPLVYDEDPGVIAYDDGNPTFIGFFLPKDITPGVNKDVTLTLRHRVNVEVHPFELSSPVEDMPAPTPMRPGVVPRRNS